MNDISTKTLQGYYDKSKRTFGSFDPKHYDEIITKINLQAKEKYKHNTIQSQEEVRNTEV